jgi:AcrR family transcriptional regulator
MADHDNEIPRRLLVAASEAFAQHGFAGTRVRDIVRDAEVNLAAVNYYFGGKEGLYAATLKELAEQRPAETSKRFDAASMDNAEDALHQQVLSILRRYVDGESSASPLGRILLHESMNPTHYFERLVADIIRPELEKLSAIVKRLAGEGVDDGTITRAAMSVMGQCLFYLFAKGAIDRIYPRYAPNREGCEALARHITGFSLMGIAVHTSKNPAG